MVRRLKLTILFCCFIYIGFSQNDKDDGANTTEIFSRITRSVSDYHLDTTAAPNDRITKKIIELRNLRGGFNINEAIAFKIEEDRRRNEISKAELDKVADFFSSGYGKIWLDNATIWIYRQHFTYGELKQLVKFYRTSAGQKMAKDFPILMLQSLKAAEIIKTIYSELQKK